MRILKCFHPFLFFSPASPRAHSIIYFNTLFHFNFPSQQPTFETSSVYNEGMLLLSLASIFPRLPNRLGVYLSDRIQEIRGDGVRLLPVSFLLMEKLGKTLDMVQKESGGVLSAHTAVQYTIEIVSPPISTVCLFESISHTFRFIRCQCRVYKLKIYCQGKIMVGRWKFCSFSYSVHIFESYWKRKEDWMAEYFCLGFWFISTLPMIYSTS